MGKASTVRDSISSPRVLDWGMVVTVMMVTLTEDRSFPRVRSGHFFVETISISAIICNRYNGLQLMQMILSFSYITIIAIIFLYLHRYR